MSKLDDLRKQNPQWDVSIFDLIKAADVSDTNRYVGMLFKFLKNNIKRPEDFIKHVTGVSQEQLVKFHQFHQEGLIEEKDVLTYKNYGDFKKQMELAEEKVKMRELEKQVAKIYEDDEWVFVVPESYEAMTIYGKGTKWCVTQKNHWRNYESQYFFVCLINKKNSKLRYCVSKCVTQDLVQCWDAADREINSFCLTIPAASLATLFQYVRDNTTCVRDMKDAKDIASGVKKIYWTTSTGRRYEVKDMDSTHIKNILNKEYMYRNGERKEAIAEMKRELKRREDGESHEPNPARSLIEQIVEETPNFGTNPCAEIPMDGGFQNGGVDLAQLRPNGNGRIYSEIAISQAATEQATNFQDMIRQVYGDMTAESYRNSIDQMREEMFRAVGIPEERLGEDEAATRRRNQERINAAIINLRRQNVDLGLSDEGEDVDLGSLSDEADFDDY